MSRLARAAIVVLVLAVMAGNTLIWFEAPCGLWRAVSKAGEMPGRCQLAGRIGRQSGPLP